MRRANEKYRTCTKCGETKKVGEFARAGGIRKEECLTCAPAKPKRQASTKKQGMSEGLRDYPPLAAAKRAVGNGVLLVDRERGIAIHCQPMSVIGNVNTLDAHIRNYTERGFTVVEMPPEKFDEIYPRGTEKRGV